MKKKLNYKRSWKVKINKTEWGSLPIFPVNYPQSLIKALFPDTKGLTAGGEKTIFNFTLKGY